MYGPIKSYAKRRLIQTIDDCHLKHQSLMIPYDHRNKIKQAFSIKHEVICVH
jgi:hypothetical protein